MIFALLAYAAAMIGANLLVAAFGPWVSPINAFFLIGLDLTLRDWLHVKLSPSRMLALILLTALVTYMLNPAADKIAIASASAFMAAALVDWAGFASLHRFPWLWRVNGSNAAGAFVDSLVFPTLAFGALLPHIAALQFAAKVAGGAVWAWVLRRSLSAGN